MELFDKVEEIINSYNLKPIELPEGFKNVYDYINHDKNQKNKFTNTEKNDIFFDIKYGDHVPNGWYGFDIGSPIIPEWNDILDKIIELCINVDPNFEIHQIKIKFGGVRFYCHSDVIKDLMKIEILITNKLYDKKLVY